MRLGKREREALKMEQGKVTIRKERDNLAPKGFPIKSCIADLWPARFASPRSDWSMSDRRGKKRQAMAVQESAPLAPFYVPENNPDRIIAGQRRGTDYGFKVPAPTVHGKAKAKAFAKASRKYRITGERD